MAFAGPPPNPDHIRRNKDTIDTTYLDWDGKVRGPTLPRSVDWHPETKKWWKHWRESPNALVMTENDWDELLMAAMLYDAVWKGETTNARGQVRTLSIQGKVQALAQVRRVTAEFGATFGDRLRLRMKIRTDFSDKEFEDTVSSDAAQIVNYMEMFKDKVHDMSLEDK